MPCLVTLSQRELHRLEAIQKIRDCRLSVVQAAELLHLSRSQVHRLLQAYDRDGAAGLVSKKRGWPSNRRHTDAFRNHVLDLVRAHYADFGPTLAREKLTNHLLGIPDGSVSNGSQKRGRKPGRRTDFVNDPAVNARREEALARLRATE